MTTAKLARVICLMLVAIMVLSFAACVNNGGNGDATTDPDANKPGGTNQGDIDYTGLTTGLKSPHVYPEYMDLYSFRGDNAVTILNCPANYWQMLCHFTYKSEDEVGQTTFEQSIWERQKTVEKSFGCEIKEKPSESIYDMNTKLTDDILNQLNTYDAAYQRADQTASAIINNYYKPLNDIENINLDAPYWTQSFLEDTSLFDTNFFAISNLQLMSFESVWALFFNVDMCENLRLDLPYETVSEGNWTWTEFKKYCTEASNLQGANSWDYNKNANTVYGMSSFVDGVNKFIYGMGGVYATKNENDTIEFLGSTPDFEDICFEVSYIMKGDGTYLAATPNQEDKTLDYYIDVFKKGRSLFLGAEIKTAQALRDLTWAKGSGIIPYPKADPVGNVKQENYMSTCVTRLPVLTIPNYAGRDEAANITSFEEIGAVVDALSHESENIVLDKYYNDHVCIKGLKTQKNIDMLNIIKNSRGFDIFVCYGFSEDMVISVNEVIHAGGTNIASTITAKYNGENGAAAQIEKLEDAISDILDQ